MTAQDRWNHRDREVHPAASQSDADVLNLTTA
jgi:hypothetical protein